MNVRFLGVEDVLLLQQNTIETEGGGRGVRDLGLLDAAVMTARQPFGGEYHHPNVPSMAAAYLYHIAMNHPFVDGNKRAAALAALVFLDANGAQRLPEPADLEHVTLSVAAGAMNKDQLSDWFRSELTGHLPFE